MLTYRDGKVHYECDGCHIVRERLPLRHPAKPLEAHFCSTSCREQWAKRPRPSRPPKGAVRVAA